MYVLLTKLYAILIHSKFLRFAGIFTFAFSGFQGGGSSELLHTVTIRWEVDIPLKCPGL
jgi:hypothetical protein